MVDDIFTLVRDRGAIAAVRYSFLSSALAKSLLSKFSSYTQTIRTLAVSMMHTKQATLIAS
jgi:hypothetical protein